MFDPWAEAPNASGHRQFVKVDVEGFEYEVIRTLVAPVAAMSFEFTPERFHPTFQCIEHLASLGTVEFNYTLRRSMNFVLASWVPGDHLCHLLRTASFPVYTGPAGDVYVRTKSDQIRTCRNALRDAALIRALIILSTRIRRHLKACSQIIAK